MYSATVYPMASELADFIVKTKHERNISWDALADEIGITSTPLRNIALQDGSPTLETLVKMSRAFKLPLWRVVQMAGVDLNLDRGDRSLADRIAALVEALPQFRPIVEHLERVRPDDLEGILIYLEGLAHRRQRDQAPNLKSGL
jgi:transcriptional regulator with XRE-family HTH domain